MDFLLVFFLSMKIYRRAKEYNENPWIWISRLVLLFFSTEIIVGLAYLSYFGMDQILPAAILALGLASISAYYIFQQFNKVIDHKEALELEKHQEKQKPNLDHFR